jgi:hypothetical protein
MLTASPTNFTGVTAVVTSNLHPTTGNPTTVYTLTVSFGNMSLSEGEVSVTIQNAQNPEAVINAVANAIREAGIGINLQLFADDRPNSEKALAAQTRVNGPGGMIAIMGTLGGSIAFQNVVAEVAVSSTSDTGFALTVRHTVATGAPVGRGDVEIFIDPATVAAHALTIIGAPILAKFDAYRSIDEVRDAAIAAAEAKLDAHDWSDFFEDVGIELTYAEDNTFGIVRIERYVGPTALTAAARDAISRDDIILDTFALGNPEKATEATKVANAILDDIRTVFNAIEGGGNPRVNQMVCRSNCECGS